MKDFPQNHQNDQGINAGADVVSHYAHATLQSFEAANWKRLKYIEKPEESESGDYVESRKPEPAGRESERNHLTGNFVDDDAL